MKNFKNVKLVSLILSLVLLVGAAIGISVSAEETADAPSLDIISKNLSYGGTISIAFAVEAQNVGENEVSLLVYDAEPASETETPAYTVTDSLAQTVYGTECLVFFTNGIAVKDMPDQIYVRAAVTVDGTTTYSELERYSVLEYAFDVQYRSDLGDDFVAIGEYLVGLGDKIQTVLPHDTENKPSDFLYAAVEQGTLDGNYNSGIYKSGDTVTLKYSGTDTFIGWDVKYVAADGTVTTALLADNTTVTLDKHLVASPASAVSTFEDGSIDSSLLKYTVNGASADASSDAAKSVFSVAADPQNATNKVLKITNYDTTTQAQINTTERSELNVKNAETPASTDVYATFEGDFYIENPLSKAGSWVMAIILKSNSYAEMLWLTLDSTGSAIIIKEANSTDSGDAGTNNQVLAAEENLLNSWFNLRIDYYVCGLESVMTVYIDGQCVYSAIAYNRASNAPSVTPITSVDIRFRQYQNFCVDNLSISTSATAPEAPEYVRDGFDAAAVPSYVTIPTDSTTVEVTASPTDAADKVLAFVQASANQPRPIIESNATSSVTSPYFTFSSDVYIKRGTKSATLNELFFAGNGGDAFRLRTYYSDNAIKLQKYTADGCSDFATPVVLPGDTWFNLRIDYYLNGTDSYINVYVDGKLVASEQNYYYNSATISNSTYVTKVQWQVTGYGSGTSHGLACYFDDLAFVNNVGSFIK